MAVLILREAFVTLLMNEPDMPASETSPVGEAQSPVGISDQATATALADLQQQLTALKDHNQTLIQEKQAALAREREALKNQKELEQKERSNRQQKLAESGQIDKLVAEHQAVVAERDRTITELQRQLDSTLADAEAQQRKLLFQTAAAGKARRPDQLYQLLREDLRVKDNKLMALSGGVEVPIGELFSTLEQTVDWEHHFLPAGGKGMGSTPARSTGDGQSNPYGPGGSFMEQVRLEAENPELARLMKANAAA